MRTPVESVAREQLCSTKRRPGLSELYHPYLFARGKIVVDGVYIVLT
jgi:hypothetical protein